MEMKNKYKVFFGLKKDPFAWDIEVKNILPTAQLQGAVERFEYSIQIGAVYLLTGEIGSGKSTAIRYLLSRLHPSEYKAVYVTAGTGSIMELYRLIAAALDMPPTGMSRALMCGRIKNQVLELINGKKKNTEWSLTKPRCCDWMYLLSCTPFVNLRWIANLTCH